MAIPTAGTPRSDSVRVIRIMRRERRERSVIDWACRLGLVCAIILVGYVGVSRSLANFLRTADPRRAHMMSPSDGRLAASLAEAEFQAKPSGSKKSDVAKLADQAIRQDATAVKAIVILASQAQLRGDLGEARRLFGYAKSLSRRNLPTQLWAIEDAVSHEDIGKALRHYDIALRTSRDAASILYPVLSAALAEPAIRSNLSMTLAKQPTWGPSFIAYILGDGAVDPRHVANLFNYMRSTGTPIAPEASSSLVNRLILRNFVEDAWQYYASLRNGMVRDRSRDTDFLSNPISTSLFDWVAGNEAGLTVSIQRSEQGGAVDFSVATGHGGMLLQQLEVLPPGVYQLSGTGSGVNQPEASLPYWSLSCESGKELGKVPLKSSNHEINSFSGIFTVPDQCPIQKLTLFARPTDRYSGITGRINRVILKPAGSG